MFPTGWPQRSHLPISRPPPRKSALGFFLALMVLYVGLGGTAQAFRPVAGPALDRALRLPAPAGDRGGGSNLRPGPLPPAGAAPAPAAGGRSAPPPAWRSSSRRPASCPSPPSSSRAPGWTPSTSPASSRALGATSWAMALIAAVLAPLAEEVAFRGYLLSALRTHLRPGVAIAASSVLFAAMHLDPVRFPAVLFLGVFLGWLAWRSGSLWPAVAAHAVNNGLGSLVACWRGGDPGAEGSGRRRGWRSIGVGARRALARWRSPGSARRRRRPTDSDDLVRTDPREPSIRFRLRLVPPGAGSRPRSGSCSSPRSASSRRFRR